jgi:hypothetical protein
MAEMETRFLKRVAEQQGFDRFGKLRGEFMVKEDAVYREFRWMREKFVALEKSVDKVTDLLERMEIFAQKMSEIEAIRPALESSRKRADKAVEEMKALMADPRVAYAAGGRAGDRPSWPRKRTARPRPSRPTGWSKWRWARLAANPARWWTRGSCMGFWEFLRGSTTGYDSELMSMDLFKIKIL